MKKTIISLTFDDGWKSAIKQACPLLERYGFCATFNIISERLDETYMEYMDANDLRIITARGHELGVHTRSHKHLPELTDEEAWHEISQGLEDLRTLGYEPRTFSYPFGEWNSSVMNQVRDAGFIAARSVDRGINDEKTNPLLLSAQPVREEHSVEQITSLIADVMNTGGWLIFYFHQIEPSAVLQERKWIYGSTPETLEAILAFS